MFKSPISISSRRNSGTEKAESANLYHCMQEKEAIMALLGIILLAIGTVIAVLHLVAWLRWRINMWLWRRRDSQTGSDGWIRPPRLNGNRQFRG